ncbi:hypothetical protein BR93DRAFT_978948 [Coniochaeta sp. PMI_546]|nr:hypothetical protein BR93DRAFT_978948 [Coniochaeta sp. PMI_546]
MRPLSGIAAAALAGLAVAGHDSAEVYLFPSPSTSQLDSLSDASPRIPKEVARHIILQRTSRDRYGSPLRTTVDEDTAITYLNTFGRSREPLFGSAEKAVEPAQLVILLEGITAENAEPLRQALSKSSQQQPAFSVPEPPSTKANDGLMADLRAEGVFSNKDCLIEDAVNPNSRSCWDGLSSVVRYDVKKSPEVIKSLAMNLDRLSRFVSSGELEALLVLLPESSRTSKLASWAAPRPSTPTSELRRRENELVISDDPPLPAATSTKSANDAFWTDNQDKALARIPACFQSLNSCETRTNKCSGGHGICIDRYQNDTKAKQPCFACHCMRTVVLDGTEPSAVGEKTIKWAGNTCQKEDVSIPFWLLAGFTIGIVGVVTFAIGLLYSVGEEKLPGVIGAGVSRGSK